MSPLIPFSFDPPAEDPSHLKRQSGPNGTVTSWPLVGATLLVPSSEYAAGFEDLEQANPGHFVHYGQTGFSVGTYHEFILRDSSTHFLLDNAPCVGFKLGTIECTFGFASPLAAELFEPYYRAKYYGDWGSIRTLRIFGAAIEEVEEAFISACMAFEAEAGFVPRLAEIDESSLFSEEAEMAEDHPDIRTLPPIILDRHPLRFFHNGLTQTDDVAACLSYYRVIEYYSFFSHSSEMRKLRHDINLSDYEFSKKVIELVSKDEKGPIFKLIKSITDKTMLDTALQDGLVQVSANTNFCESLYSFRNSIVHGKFSAGFALQSTPVIGVDYTVAKWRQVLRLLAERALSKFATRKI